MARIPADSGSQKIAFAAIAFGAVALLLVCVGVGTPNWYVTAGSVYTSSSANYFYYCTYDSNGNFVSCTSRSGTSHPYCNNLGTTAVSYPSDCNTRMQNASGLSIVGILFLFFGLVATLLMTLGFFNKAWINFIPPALLFLACLFMLAGMAEGSRYLAYNGYSANLYQTGHLLTMLTLFLSSLAAGRIDFSRGPAGRGNAPTT